MNASELKRVLEIAVRPLDTLLKSDLTDLSVDPEWSDIDSVEEHIDFLRDQIAGLMNSLRDRPASASKDNG